MGTTKRKEKPMKDTFKYSDGSRWKYTSNWFNPRKTTSSKCWKDQRKTKHQYKPNRRDGITSTKED